VSWSYEASVAYIGGELFDSSDFARFKAAAAELSNSRFHGGEEVEESSDSEPPMRDGSVSRN
jgi:hypothetical protein